MREKLLSDVWCSATPLAILQSESNWIDLPQTQSFFAAEIHTLNNIRMNVSLAKHSLEQTYQKLHIDSESTFQQLQQNKDRSLQEPLDLTLEVLVLCAKMKGIYIRRKEKRDQERSEWVMKHLTDEEEGGGTIIFGYDGSQIKN
jgi:hypothetical protein